MKVSVEDKIFKSAGLIALFTVIFVKNEQIKIYIVFPLTALLLVLALRKYVRDKREGKPLKKYYIALGFMLFSLLLSFAFYWYVITYGI